MAQQTFGETVRKLREENEMPLRKLAALLDIDQSTLRSFLSILLKVD